MDETTALRIVCDRQKTPTGWTTLGEAADVLADSLDCCYATIRLLWSYVPEKELLPIDADAAAAIACIQRALDRALDQSLSRG